MKCYIKFSIYDFLIKSLGLCIRQLRQNSFMAETNKYRKANNVTYTKLHSQKLSFLVYLPITITSKSVQNKNSEINRINILYNASISLFQEPYYSLCVII